MMCVETFIVENFDVWMLNDGFLPGDLLSYR